MKHLLAITFIFGICSFSSPAQTKPEDPAVIKRLKVEKISFLAVELQLTPEEAQKFWPVYNEFERKRFKLEFDRRKIELEVTDDINKLQDQALIKLGEEYIDLHQNEAQLIAEYHQKFLKVLPVKKVFQLYQAERQFKSHMLREFRRRGAMNNQAQ